MLKNFQKILKNYESYGFALNQPFLNRRSTVILFIFSLLLVSNIIYCCCEAKSFQEYADSIFMGTVIIGTAVIYVYLLMTSRQMFDVLDQLEETVDDRE